MTQKDITNILLKQGVGEDLAKRSSKAVFSYWYGGTMERLIKFVEHFNNIRNTKYKPVPNLINNFDYWLKVYSPEEMLQAIKNCDEENWMDKDLSPTKLLRTRNQNGDCDYISDLLNYTPKKKQDVVAKKIQFVN
jgi:hypothetical protein